MTNEQNTQITQEQQEIILSVLKKITPLDVDIAGEVTTKRIVKGCDFTSIEGGHHIDLGASIGLISGIASLTQMLLLTGIWIGKQIGTKKNRKSELINEIQLKVDKHEQLREIILNDPHLISKIYDVLDALHESSTNAKLFDEN